jgi:MFS transporter, PAT family, beta-lactamase induction signal transducer AmpG
MKNFKKGWAWVPSLYFAEGLPYVVVITVSVIMYKRLGISNTDIALYTSWLYLPWVIKPFWSPFVDIIKTKRWWIVIMQLLIGGGFAGVAFTLPMENFFQYTLAFMWLLAFSSATHDIAADGFYMLGLNKHDQAWFVGIRGSFYRVAMIVGQGPLVILAGYIEESNPENIRWAWVLVLALLAVMFLVLLIYHKLILPKPVEDTTQTGKNILAEFVQTWLLFFKKDNIFSIIAFLLLFRFAEGQLVKLAAPFLLDPTDVGGLGLSTTEVGFVYGTVGLLFLTFGGVLGGFLAARNGLKYWLWPMAIAINLPDLVYVFLSWTQTQSMLWINVAVAIEQFGYGFGFTAYMLVMIYVSQGKYKTAHFAITTAFMALSMMIPGMISGWLQEMLGYRNFFIWIMLATIPAILVIKLIKIDPEFGMREKEGN